MNTDEPFGGDKKLPMKSALARLERRVIDSNLDRFPRWLQGYHLTLMTIPLSAGLIVFGYLAAHSSLHWLWASSLMLVAQWFTDSFDGALGRHRDTGIPRWGYYMDHFLDYVFMAALLIGYAFLFEGLPRQLIYLLIPVFGAFMVSSYLAFGATNEFKITFLGAGPTEIRLYFIALNAAIVFFGTAWLEKVLPFILPAGIAVLTVVIYRTQKYIWNKDMAEKHACSDQNRDPHP